MLLASAQMRELRFVTKPALIIFSLLAALAASRRMLLCHADVDLLPICRCCRADALFAPPCAATAAAQLMITRCH